MWNQYFKISAAGTGAPTNYILKFINIAKVDKYFENIEKENQYCESE